MNIIYWSRPFWLEVTEPKSTQLEGKEVLANLLNQECIDQPNDRKTRVHLGLGKPETLECHRNLYFPFLVSISLCGFCCCSISLLFFVCVCVCVLFVFGFFFFFCLASGLRDLSSPTRDQTQGQGSRSLNPKPLDHQGILCLCEEIVFFL